MGRLVADPETRYTPNNVSTCRFKLAVNRQGKKQEGQPTADFLEIVAWRSTADFIGKYFKKGQQVLVEGYLRNNSWTDKEGNKRYRDEIHVDQVYFADSKQNNGGGGYQQQAAPSYQAPAQGQGHSEGFYDLNQDDEDLPF